MLTYADVISRLDACSRHGVHSMFGHIYGKLHELQLFCSGSVTFILIQFWENVGRKIGWHRHLSGWSPFTYSIRHYEAQYEPEMEDFLKKVRAQISR